jgi:hypothetical protein
VAVTATTPVIRAAAAALAFLACVPLLLAGWVVSGGASSSLPFVLAAAATAWSVSAFARERLRLYASGAAAALFLVLASTVTDSTRVETQAELERTRFGLPFGYVEAELSATPPLPYEQTWNPWEDPARLRPWALLASCGVAVCVAAAAVRLTQAARRPRATRSPRPGS